MGGANGHWFRYCSNFDGFEDPTDSGAPIEPKQLEKRAIMGK